VRTRLIVLALRGAQGLTALAVLGAMALVAVRVSGREDSPRVSSVQVDLKTLALALSQYATDTGDYPTTDDGLMALVMRPSPIPGASWKGPYLDSNELPKDPWGHDYVYLRPAPGESPALFSAGPDAIMGSGDDICVQIRRQP